MDSIQLKTVSAVEAVVSALEHDIFFSFLPGEKMTENILISRYGVSRNTLREAMSRLVSCGILVKIANRGVFVREITREDVREIFSLRALLEAEAIERIIKNGAETKLLLEKAELLQKSNPAENWDEYVSADIDFHTLLVSASGSSRLIRLYDSIISEVKLCICQSKQHIPLGVVNEISHKSVLDAISEKDLPAAKALIEKHIETATHNYENGFEKIKQE